MDEENSEWIDYYDRKLMEADYERRKVNRFTWKDREEVSPSRASQNLYTMLMKIDEGRNGKNSNQDNPSKVDQQIQETTSKCKKSRGRPKKYDSQEEANNARKEQIKAAKLHYKAKDKFRRDHFCTEQKYLMEILKEYVLSRDDCLKIIPIVKTIPENTVEMQMTSKDLGAIHDKFSHHSQSKK